MGIERQIQGRGGRGRVRARMVDWVVERGVGIFFEILLRHIQISGVRVLE